MQARVEAAAAATMADLQAELDALRQAPPDDAAEDGGDAQLAALTTQLAELNRQADDLRVEAREAEAQARTQENDARMLRAQLEAAQAELQAAQFGPEGALPEAVGSGVPLEDAEAAQLAVLEARRAEAVALREARVTSPMIAFGGSASPGACSSTSRGRSSGA